MGAAACGDRDFPLAPPDAADLAVSGEAISAPAAIQIYKGFDPFGGREEGVLEELGFVGGVDFEVHPTGQLLTGIPASTRVVILPSNFGGAGPINDVNSPDAQAHLDAFVQGGGILVISLADNVNATSYRGPGVASVTSNIPVTNSYDLAAASHPISVGPDGNAPSADNWTQENIQWSSGCCAVRGYLPPLPAGAQVILTSSGNPVMADYSYGLGRVIVRTTLFEAGDQDDPGGSSGGAPRRLLRNELYCATSFAVSPVADAGGPYSVVIDQVDLDVQPKSFMKPASSGMITVVLSSPPDPITPVALDGSGSRYPGVDELTYTWTITGSSGEPIQASGKYPTVLLGVDVYSVELIVSDGAVTATDTTTISVTLLNLETVAAADLYLQEIRATQSVMLGSSRRALFPRGPVVSTLPVGDSVTVQLSGAATGSDVVRVLGTVGQVVVDPATTILWPDGRRQLTVTLFDRHGNLLLGPAVTWVSDNSAVATVDAAGLVTGAQEGTATITATSQDVSGTSTIRVAAFASVSAGEGRSCGLTTDGAAYCWGYDGAGGLGSGTDIDSSTVPLAVVGGHTFESVEVGHFASCGVTIAGAAYCWGGALGDGTNTSSNEPVAVAGGHVFDHVSAGTRHNCGVTLAGAAYCWGLSGGALGAGTNISSNVPVAVVGGHVFASISAGLDHSCGVTTSGAAYCWGLNPFGQLGDGTTTDRNVPVPVAGGHTFAAISAGNHHSCGVTTAGAAYCWGLGNFGQLGSGSAMPPTSVPVGVAGGHTFDSVSAGFQHSCGLSASGAAYCWGANSSPFSDITGLLGDGTGTGASYVPVMVAGGHTFTSVSADFSHSCGITTTGAPYCWGGNHHGALGDATTTHRNVPVLVSTPF
jgi:alpha-tubulin suppressor-like RCC1 family protein